MNYIIITLLLVVVAQLFWLTSRLSTTSTKKKQGVYVDTSVLMDGRILTIARTGFIAPRLIVTTSVIAELQYMADQADSEKRLRARAGLDAVKELQAMKTVQVVIYDDGPLGEGGVDARLVELSKSSGGMLCTIDYNLNKVASISGIFVLNINELAQSIRMMFLPGEVFSLLLNQKGQDAHQAVGYLEDGTMVVVENGAGSIGEVVAVEFTRSLQTAAGRMMFARLKGSPAKDTKPTRKTLGRHGDKNKDTATTSSSARSVVDKNRSDARSTPRTRTANRSKRGSQAAKEDELIRLVENQ